MLVPIELPRPKCRIEGYIISLKPSYFPLARTELIMTYNTMPIAPGTTFKPFWCVDIRNKRIHGMVNHAMFLNHPS